MGFVVGDGMWVKVPAVHVFEERVATAIVTRVMMVNAGWMAEKHYATLLSDESFSEDRIRQILVPHYRGVENWTLHLIRFNFELQRFEVLVSSLDFEPVPFGVYPPVLQPMEIGEAP